MSPYGRFIISFDLGTSSFKAALYDQKGSLVAKEMQSLSIHYPQAGWAEQDPEQWWALAQTLVKALKAKNKLQNDQISALVFTTQMCSTIAIDEDGTPLTSAISWLDTRSEDLVKQKVRGIFNLFGYGLRAVLEWLYICRGAPNLSGKDPFSKYLWIKEKRPDIWMKTRYCLDAKDFLLFKCTHQAKTSPDSAFFTWLVNFKTRKWSDYLIRRNGFERTKLPDIVEPTTLIEGGLSVDAAKHLDLQAGTSVAIGLGDITSTALGSGATLNGKPHLYFGTSNWAAAHIPSPKVSPFTYIGSICSAFSNRSLLIAAQENAGNILETMTSFLTDGSSVRAFFSLAEQSSPGANGVMFMPWLNGERAPVDDSNIRGGFLNIGPTTTKADMARAVIEAIVYNQFWATGYLFKMAKNNQPTDIPVVGGLAQSDLLMQTLADVFQTSFIRSHNPQWAGTRGGYCCAASALGWYSDLDQACALKEATTTFHPNHAQADCHQKRFIRFKKAYKQVRGWYK
ncbi:xylulokinase [Terasakiella pusilla]|uniref:xylulokinase n=1 Tax=Terasakiella pusilla TaxID=64973 RepID=UPI0004916E99|nr:FGGY-family carbohydrate kinase [Terasakiella pusilla]